MDYVVDAGVILHHCSILVCFLAFFLHPFHACGHNSVVAETTKLMVRLEQYSRGL